MSWHQLLYHIKADRWDCYTRCCATRCIFNLQSIPFKIRVPSNKIGLACCFCKICWYTTYSYAFCCKRRLSYWFLLHSCPAAFARVAHGSARVESDLRYQEACVTFHTKDGKSYTGTFSTLHQETDRDGQEKVWKWYFFVTLDWVIKGSLVRNFHSYGQLDSSVKRYSNQEVTIQ